MKIALVAQPLDSLHPKMETSLGLWCQSAARYLSTFCEVVLYCSQTGVKRVAAPMKRVQIKSIPSVHYKLQMIPARLLSPWFRRRRPFFSSSFFCADYFLGVARDLRHRGCDVAHVLNFSQAIPVIRRHNPEIGIVLHMECEWLSQLDRRRVEARLATVDAIIGCSEYITDKIRLRFPELEGKCRTIANGVDPRCFRPGNGKGRVRDPAQRILFVGRVSPEKGVHVLLKAFCAVAENHPQAQLHLIGATKVAPSEFIVDLSDEGKVAALKRHYGKDYLAQLKNSIPSGLRNRVFFHGHVPHNRLSREYAAADVLVNPSLSEAFGISLIEGMSAGLPVVATACGGMQETVVDGETGILVQPGDVDSLARGMLRLVSNQPLRKSMGRAGRKRATTVYSWKNIGAKLFRLYGAIREQHAR